MSSAAASDPEPSTMKASARVAQLFERHGRMVFGICRTMLRDVHEAEDATQQAFLSAHRALLGGAEVRDAGAWIAAIARNECRGRISAGMRHPLPVPHDDLVDLALETDVLEQRARASELIDALAGLPERQREAVVLRYVHGLRYVEVAKALGLSRPATEALLFRARRSMRLHLRPVVGAAIAVPEAVRTGLASALPGFEPDPGPVTGVGLIGGLLAKLATAPTVAKIGTVSIAATAIGTAGVVQSEGPSRQGAVAAPAIRSDTTLRSGTTATRSDDVMPRRRLRARSLPRRPEHASRAAPGLRADDRESSASSTDEPAHDRSGEVAVFLLPEPAPGVVSASGKDQEGASRPPERERETASSPAGADGKGVGDPSEPQPASTSGSDDGSPDASSSGSGSPDVSPDGLESSDSSSGGDSSGGSGDSGSSGSATDDGT
jgi:RNA polymerase sigma-70 factor (ECF subfamily)